MAPGSRPSRRRTGSMSPQSVGEWLTLAPRLTGIAGLLGAFLFWAATSLIDPPGRVEPAFVTAFVGLIAAGQGIEALAVLRSPPPNQKHDEGDG